MIRARSIALAALLASTSLAHAGSAPKKVAKINTRSRAPESSAKKINGGKLAGKRAARGERTITPQQEEALAEPEVAEAVEPIAATKGPNLASRLARGTFRGIGVAGRAVGSFVAGQFKMRAEMKDTLAEVKFLRQGGELTAAAELLRDTPKTAGLWEGFRAWRAKKAVLSAARKQLKVKSVDSDPGEGYAAIATLDQAGKTSFVDRIRAGRALRTGVKNAVKMARKLGDGGRLAEARDLLEWSLSEGETIDAKTTDVMDRLYGQAMKASDRASMRFVKARSLAGQQSTFNETLEAMDLASRFSDLYGHVTGQALFDENRAGRIVVRTGLSHEQFSAALDELRGVAQQPATAAPEPAAAATANEAPQL